MSDDHAKASMSSVTASRVLAADLSDPEAPVLLPDGRWAIVEMSPDTGCVTIIDPKDRSKQVLAKTGRPNGLAIDAEGDLWIANSVPPSLMRLDFAGNLEVVTRGSESLPFLWPNDLCFGPDGAIYMTDSGVDHGPWQKVAPQDRLDAKLDGRVLRIDPKTGSVQLIDRGLRFANGIAFGPDKRLYANESLTSKVYVYDWKDGGVVPERRPFGDVRDAEPDDGIISHPDGMAFGADGCLYVSIYSRGDIVALDAGGAVVKRLSTELPRMTNLAFGPKGEKTFCTTSATSDRVGQLCLYEIDTEGLALFK
jgi:gluconolactonase